MTLTCRFEALDSWFFRESRPHNSMGDSELGSVFPPSPRTIAGALRTLIGEAVGVDWSAFAAGDGRRHRLGQKLDLRQEIGFGDNLGNLQLDGPWLARAVASDDTRPLFPAPRLLVAKRGPREVETIQRLSIGSPITCDLGRVRLPEIPASGVRSLEDTWLTGEGLTATLDGATPRLDHLVKREDLFREEPRLGIARANNRRTTIDGLLYQNRHIRPAADLVLEVGISGIDSRLLELGLADAAKRTKARLVRLGGEGRLTAITIRERATALPPAPRPAAKGDGLVLCLLSAADIGTKDHLPGFRRNDGGGARVWEGEIADVPLTLHSAAVGRAVREGGWDLARRRPRPVRSLIPAGSCWYCTVRDQTPLDQAIKKLHGAQIGNEHSLGRGRLAVGLWSSSEINLTEEHTP